MQFLNPFALVGLAAALIPLALHLLHRGRPSEVPFSNLAFLRELHQSRMRSVRLRQWLVLLLRTLALACLALAFARPALQRSGSGLLGGSLATAGILLVDRSYSTGYSAPQGRLFDQLRRRAGEAVDLLAESGDGIYLIPFDEGADASEEPLTPQGARDRLADLAPGEGGTDLAQPLLRAAQLLARIPGRHGEVYLFTDLARPGWDSLSAEDTDRLLDTPVFLLPPASAPRRNLSVAAQEVAGWLAAPGQRLSVRAAVAQFGGAQAASVAVDLYLDGERVQRHQVEVPAAGQVACEFSVAPRRAGRLTGFVEVEADLLPADNRRYFTLHVPERIAVLLAGPRLADTYYPRRALAAAAAGDAALQVEAVTLEQLDDERLAAADVLVLCNVEAPAPAAVEGVRRFCRAGGGLLVFPGPEADLARLNRQLLADLVPAALSGVRGRAADPAFASLDSARAEPILFADLHARAQDRPRFHAFFELAVDQPLAVLARFDDGHAALVEGRGPSGRSLLWATPLDLAWSDLPLRGLFVPLLHRLCRYLAQPPSHAVGYAVGEGAWRRLPGMGADDRVQAQSPSGRRRYLESEAVLGERLWRIPDLDEAGIWQVLGPAGEAVDEFAVNVEAAEADVVPVETRDAIQRLGSARARVLDAGAPLREAVLSARYGRELWRELLLLAGILLLVELWVARAPEAEARPAQSGGRRVSKV